MDPRALIYEQVNTAKSGRYQITKTYVTDTRRSTVLLRVRFTALRPGDLSNVRSVRPGDRQLVPRRHRVADWAEWRRGDAHRPGRHPTRPWSPRPASCARPTASSAPATGRRTLEEDNQRLDFDYDTATLPRRCRVWWVLRLAKRPNEGRGRAHRVPVSSRRLGRVRVRAPGRRCRRLVSRRRTRGRSRRTVPTRARDLRRHRQPAARPGSASRPEGGVGEHATHRMHRDARPPRRCTAVRRNLRR